VRPDIPFTFPKFLQTIAIMSQITRAIAVYLLATANIALAANCFDTPKWTWYGNDLYTDVWGARSTLCTRGAAPCTSNPDETISCQVKVGNAYAVMEGINLDDMYTYCGDAFNDINNQCVYTNQIGGNYHWDQNSYWLQPIVTDANYLR